MSMKFNLKTTAFILLGFIFLTNSCKKDKNSDLVTDIDGNVYHTVTIGSQVWMVENLKTTRYRNGEKIAYATENQEWLNVASSGGAYCDYDFVEANGKNYGHLYSWYAVKNPDSEKILAPEGWHVPTKAEWQTLIDFLGGEDFAGGKLKEKGNLHWQIPNNVSIDEYGFNLLPSGFLQYGGVTFYDLGISANLWSSTQINDEAAFHILAFNDTEAAGYQFATLKRDGLAVRCIKGN